MELTKIRALLQKYDQGGSTLKEEGILRDYFKNNSDIPVEWKSYKLIFAFSEKQSKQEPAINFSVKDKKTSLIPKSWFAIAAILIVALGIFFYNDYNQNSSGLTSEEQLAYENAKKSLDMVASLLNQGTEELAYLKEFNNTTHKIIQID